MIRPPPLQLKYDNRFPYPLKTPRPVKGFKKSFFAQLYKANWKNPIIARTSNGNNRDEPRSEVFDTFHLSSCFSEWASIRICYNAFNDVVVDSEEKEKNLMMVSIALSVMYCTSCMIEIYGIIGVSMQRMGLVRAYLYLSFIGAIVVTCAGATKGISYFVLAEDIVWQCVSLARKGRIGEKSTFRSRMWPGPNAVKRIGARKHCVYSWVYQSWSEIASVFLFALIPAVISYIMVYIYYRQTINPKHPASLIRGKRRQSANDSQRRPNAGQGGYSRVATRDSQDGGSVAESTQSQDDMRTTSLHALSPRQRSAKRRSQVSQQRSLRGVGANSTSMSVGTSTRNAGTRASGPSNVGAAKKPPLVSKGLQRSHRPPPLVPSPSPLGLGPPNYGPSKVYAAFAAPLASSDYDKFV
ncbi:hypothetical protein CVT24_003151 [Panaeolus cyanescens]|uniref:Uncharacterized protein n=1 Tax=Panaeolus cyanescens TaxID=181874 RepID=A0A409VNQ5_9AGAR|nr:hypothetical protein CVT24_003151 [Panaeolus cyanescens]